MEWCKLMVVMLVDVASAAPELEGSWEVPGRYLRGSSIVV